MKDFSLFISDLTHTSSGIMSNTHPLGSAYVAAYCQDQFKGNIDIKLYKYPDDLIKSLSSKLPQILAFSNYSWNLELSYEIAKWAKSIDPKIITVFGGPNFPTDIEEQKDFLNERSCIDFYIQSEGEIGLAKLIEQLSEVDFDYIKLKETKIACINSVYLWADDIYAGDIERISDVNVLPSPYLTGVLDEFFDMPLTPMIETTRGCPFSCTFCADGAKIKNKIHRFESERVREELNYIASHVKQSDELIITDLNFGMYKEDTLTANVLAEVQIKHNWPIIVKGSAGKNKTERIIDVATILKGSWIIGAAIQSTDMEVLDNIKRKNISLDSYRKFLGAMNELNEDASTYTEIILGLPGDSKEKHFASLRDAVDSEVINVKSYQSMLLVGTDMATGISRKDYGFVSKFRVMAGGAGLYKYKDIKIKALEVQEIVVGNKNMTFDEYLACRKMDFILEGFYNNSPYRELLESFKSIGFAIFDLLQFLSSRPDLYNKKVANIFDIYTKMSNSNLFDTFEEARNQSDANLELYEKGEFGFNETLECKAMLYLAIEDTLETITRTIIEFLKEQGIASDFLEKYFNQLQDYVYLKKHDITANKNQHKKLFDFNFALLDSHGFTEDPRTVETYSHPIEHIFYHEEDQQKHIDKSLNQYESHSGGFSRFLYNQNLNKMYRKVKTSGKAVVSEVEGLSIAT